MTANQRIVPENSKFDVGATMISTPRSIRLNELISEGIKSGKKFDEKDMIAMQQDMVDVVARGLTPHILKVVRRVLIN